MSTLAINPGRELQERNDYKNKVHLRLKNTTNSCSIEQARLAVQESKSELIAAMSQADFLICVAGFGGSVGTGATTEIIKLAKQIEIPITVMVVLPFKFEDSRREFALTELSK